MNLHDPSMHTAMAVGGYLTDESARVLSKSGQPIEGLYASGNVSASVMGSGYPGPGSPWDRP